MSYQLSWDSFWAFFDTSSNEDKAYYWKQLNLEHTILGLDSKHQIEVLQKAPQEVVDLVKKHIHLETLLALRPAKTKAPVTNQRMSKRVIRMTIG